MTCRYISTPYRFIFDDYLNSFFCNWLCCSVKMVNECRLHQHITAHFRDTSFQSITCTGTDSRTRSTKRQNMENVKQQNAITGGDPPPGRPRRTWTHTVQKSLVSAMPRGCEHKTDRIGMKQWRRRRFGMWPASDDVVDDDDASKWP